jgi:ATP-dependent RNA helicase DHX29
MLWSVRSGQYPKTHLTPGAVSLFHRLTIFPESDYRPVHDKFYKGKNRPDWTEDLSTLEDEDEEGGSKTNVKLEKRYSPETAATLNIMDERLIPYDLIVRLLEVICFEDPNYHDLSAAVLVFMPGLAEIRRLNDLLVEHPLFGSSDFKLYPLHSTLTSESQGAVFEVPPVGIRKIVVGGWTSSIVPLALMTALATNIAETGITIPDITCVIDSGKHREMRFDYSYRVSIYCSTVSRFDEKRQISRLIETFIAKSNAAQRRGRAGRVQNGLCFHLFTKIRHETQVGRYQCKIIRH